MEYLKQFSADTGAAFQALRKAVLQSGPLDTPVGEFIVLGALATSGGEGSFKIHGRRLLKEGVQVEALRQAVLVTLGASTTLAQVIAALKWIDDIVAESRG